jgi:uncharacterized MAPEG superfamily protein
VLFGSAGNRLKAGSKQGEPSPSFAFHASIPAGRGNDAMQMTIAFWCVLIAALFPYAVVGMAKAGGGYDNREPRNPEIYATERRRRAHAAHQNSFEAFPFFAAAVFIASLTIDVGQIHVVDAMAVTWVVLRIVYVACYLGDRASLRSIIWILALLDTVAIFTSPVWTPLLNLPHS